MKKNEFGVILLIVAAIVVAIILTHLLSFTPNKTDNSIIRNTEDIQKNNNILLNFTDESFEQKSTIISKDTITEIYLEYDFEDSKFIIFKNTGDEENAHSGVIISDTIYDFGEVSTLFEVDQCTITTIDIYGIMLVKITGILGVAYAPSEYYSIDSNENGRFPRIVLRVENYNNKEVDLDSDGMKEVFECSMFSSLLHRYDAKSNKFYVADLIADTRAMQVVMDDNNLFTSYTENGVVSGVYKYSNGQFSENSDTQVVKILELPQGAIEIDTFESTPLETPITFQHGDNNYKIKFCFEKIGFGDPDIAPRVKLYFCLMDEVKSDYYYIGEYISGVPTMYPTDIYDVGKEVIASCFTWYGGSGKVIFVAKENNNIFIYEVYADIPAEYAVPVEITFINIDK